MLYKTIILDLFRTYNLPQTIPSLDLYSNELRQSHQDWTRKFQEANPDNSQASSQAMELALEEMQDHFRAMSSEQAEAPPA